jgi:peroxiredoxin (alkyl hydroperoxide reductase subunit C)
MPNETRTLKVGDEAPDFSLRSTAGGVFKLSEQRGKNVVLVFFPAAFSGVCSQQMPQIQSQIGDFESSDAVVVGISTDNNWSQQAWAQQMGVSFPLLSDFFPHGAVSEKYGVLHAAGVAERAIVGVDKGGKVGYIDVSPAFTEIPDTGACLLALKG